MLQEPLQDYWLESSSLCLNTFARIPAPFGFHGRVIFVILNAIVFVIVSAVTPKRNEKLLEEIRCTARKICENFIARSFSFIFLESSEQQASNLLAINLFRLLFGYTQILSPKINHPQREPNIYQR